MNKRKAAETFHPGVFLEEELEERGWSQADFAEILGRDSRTISEVISGKRSITPETAIGLAEALGSSPQLWMSLEATFQLSKIERKPNLVANKAKLFEKFPVREMIKRGWVEASESVEVLTSRFCEFFEISNLDATPNFNHAARKSNSHEIESSRIQNAWLFRARHLAKTVYVPYKFTQTRLNTCFNKLRLLLHEEEEVRHIPKILSETGIRFVIVESIPKSKMDGATFWLDDESPVIAIALRFDRIDNFWFTLMHELSHVANGEGKEQACVDIDMFCETINRLEKPEFEQRADKDASEFFIAEDLIQDFIFRIYPYFLESKIRGFAALHKIHEGIVVGQLQRRDQIPYSHHRKMLVKIREKLLGAALTDGFGYTPKI